MPADPSVALARWLDAVNSRGEPEAVEAAVIEEVTVARCGWSEGHRGTEESLDGFEDVQEWLWTNPHGCVFSAGPIAESNGAYEVRYTIRYQDFENHGVWRFTVSHDGRIATLVHQPDDLPDAWKEGIPEGARFEWEPDPRASAAPVHDHDHE